MHVQKMCQKCATPYSVKPSHADRRKYCSRTCSDPKDANAIFWSKVDKSGGAAACWLRDGAVTRNGYGKFSRTTAHRFAWQSANGAIPKGLNICHTCDNPPCVNPAHLWLGTTAQNVADKIAKGRQLRGESITTAKLCAAQVTNIRERLAHGETCDSLALDFGCSDVQISNIARGKSWGHLGGEVAGRRQNSRGENNGCAKLTNSKVTEIKAALTAGAVQRRLAERYGVSNQIINDIATNRTWRTV